MNNNPIGILDSGVGGLTVWKEVQALLPNESIVYLGDSNKAPYGARTQDEIYHLSKKLIDFLLTKKVKLIVVACNTITVSCLDKLRSDYPELPLVGTVPVVKTAGEVTKNKRIGILSTSRTAESHYQKELINKFAADCKVFVHGTDVLVPLIEKGKQYGGKMQNRLNHALAKFQEEKVDTLVLGSTHFPFLRPQIEAIMGPHVRVLDSGPAIARQTKRVLENNHALSEKTQPTLAFYTTGNATIAKILLASTIKGKELPGFKVISL